MKGALIWVRDLFDLVARDPLAGVEERDARNLKDDDMYTTPDAKVNNRLITCARPVREA